MTVGYLLRRNNWGEESCSNISKHFEDFLTVVNKDKDKFPDNVEWCIRWGTTSDIPNHKKVKVINKAAAIHAVYNKASFRKKMSDNELAPLTIINEVPLDNHPIYPAVLRPTRHFGSNDVYCVSNKKEAEKYIKEIKDDLKNEYEGFYLSRFVDKDREFRVFIVSGRTVAVLEKIPSDLIKKEDVSWGVGEADWKYIAWNKWPISVVKIACSAFKLSGLDFGAVDMILQGNMAYCLEINTAPLVSPYYAGQFAKGFKYIIEKDDRSFIEPGPDNNYKSYIHPTLVGEPN